MWACWQLALSVPVKTRRPLPSTVISSLAGEEEDVFSLLRRLANTAHAAHDPDSIRHDGAADGPWGLAIGPLVDLGPGCCPKSAAAAVSRMRNVTPAPADNHVFAY